MKAYRIFENDKQGMGKLVDMDVSELDQGEILIRNCYAGINYKDALAGLGTAPIIRRYPCNAGIEAFGIVEHSDHPGIAKGDHVIAHGRGLGVDHDGGLAEYVRLPGSWVQNCPEGLSLRECAILGVAGYSAALAVDRLERLGLTPDMGPVAVTGATGGVGSFAVEMLSQRGFDVTALTAKPAADWLRARGAKTIRPAPEPSARPLDKALWAGAVDATGGPHLEYLLQTAKQDAVIASIGNAAGVALSTTVLPFILRGVTLVGINANSPDTLRNRIWQRMGTDLKPAHLDDTARMMPLETLPAFLETLLAGQITGRGIVDFGQEA